MMFYKLYTMVKLPFFSNRLNQTVKEKFETSVNLRLTEEDPSVKHISIPCTVHCTLQDEYQKTIYCYCYLPLCPMEHRWSIDLRRVEDYFSAVFIQNNISAQHYAFLIQQCCEQIEQSYNFCSHRSNIKPVYSFTL